MANGASILNISALLFVYTQTQPSRNWCGERRFVTIQQLLLQRTVWLVPTNALLL